MTKKTMILPETALSKYLELGQGRSLNKLHKTLGNNAPSYDTLKRWCNRFDWVKIAQETDYKARKKLQEKHSTEISEKTFNEISELQEINKKLLTRINQELNALDLNLKPEQIKSLGDLALSVSKHTQVLTGGVSERTELTNIEQLSQSELKQYINKLMIDLDMRPEDAEEGESKKTH